MSARRAAAELVIAVTDDGKTLDSALNTTRSLEGLDPRDRAFARAIASATLRRLGGLDAVLAHFLARPVPDSAPAAKALLRTGAAQILVLGAAPHAVVAETVALADAHRALRGFKGLLNAVLRRVATEGPPLFAAIPRGGDLPAWLFTRWRAAYGAEEAAAIAAALREEPPLDLTAKADPAAWAEALGAQSVLGATIRLPRERRGGVSIERLPGYAEGAWWVQDAAAALPAQLLGDVRGRRVLDLCAAPGGKTLQLAAKGALVTALDKDAARLPRLKANLARTGLSAEIICADALEWTPSTPFDAILLDAPCSATGTLRRRPDIAWLRRPTDIANLAAIQRALLARSAQWLRPGGALVYAVCSLEPEEGEAIAAAPPPGLEPFPLAPGEAPADFITARGDLRTKPSHWPAFGGLDGFFAARWRRP